jgi:hypothetical protein
LTTLSSNTLPATRPAADVALYLSGFVAMILLLALVNRDAQKPQHIAIDINATRFVSIESDRRIARR